MSFFLKLRHWQLALMLALPGIATVLFGLPFEPLVASGVGLCMLLVLFGWMFSIGAWSNRQLAATRHRNLILYGAGFALPIIYLLLYIFVIIPQFADGGPERPPLWMLPMHMLSLVGIFYGIWFTASQLKALLESHDANFMIFSNTFFLLFIFPIGIWLIQPGVNQLYAKLQDSGADET